MEPLTSDRVLSIEERLRRIRRTCEMSAEIMRDKRRTGSWEGAERVAAQFDRMAALATLPADETEAGT